MRILFWSAGFWPTMGGVEVLAAKLLPALQGRGHKFIVVAPKCYSNLTDHEQYNGIPVYRLPFRNSFTENTIDYVIDIRREVLKLKQDFQPDLVHINAVSRGDFFHFTTNNAYRVPSLVTLHGQWEKEIEPVVGHTLRSADWIAGCSGAILDRARQLVPEITPRSSIVYNAVEAPPISPEPLPFGAPRIVCLGRLAPEKGIDLALAAFATIVTRFPHARLIIAGDGRLKYALQRQAADCGIAHAVDFIGWVAPKAVPSLLNASTVLLMPSRQDSMPLVALETASMARPIVATNVGGLPEVVAHRETGLLVEKEDIPALADAVSYLLDHPEVAVSMGQAARRRAQTIFSWEQHVDAYDALYRKLRRQEPSVHGDQSSIYRRKNDACGNKM
jgi:glycosyltransferase involved in cell wall biosynthesis